MLLLQFVSNLLHGENPRASYCFNRNLTFATYGAMYSEESRGNNVV